MPDQDTNLSPVEQSVEAGPKFGRVLRTLVWLVPIIIVIVIVVLAVLGPAMGTVYSNVLIGI